MSKFVSDIGTPQMQHGDGWDVAWQRIGNGALRLADALVALENGLPWRVVRWPACHDAAVAGPAVLPGRRSREALDLLARQHTSTNNNRTKT